MTIAISPSIANAVINVLITFVLWLAYIVVVIKLQPYIRILVVKAMLWHRSNQYNRVKVNELKAEAKAKDLLELVKKKGFNLENME
jgi:hypothetical protein